MSLRGDMIKRARARVDARARDRARDEARAEYGRNLSKRKFEPKRSVGNLGDKIIETVRGVSGDAKRKVSNITDATGEGIMGVYDAGAKFMQSLMSNIDRSAQNREILGDAYTDDLRKSMMTDDDLEFYNKYVGLADLASDNQERERLMDIANTAMQNANITKRINYALGQPGFGFETTATAGQEPFFGDENIDYSTLVDRMVGGTDASTGLEGTAIGQAFLDKAYKEADKETGGNLISDAIMNYRDPIRDMVPPLSQSELMNVTEQDVLPIEGVSNQPNIDDYNEMMTTPFNAANIYSNLNFPFLRNKVFPGMALEDITQEDLDNLSIQDRMLLGYVG